MNSGFGKFLLAMALLAAVISFVNIQKLNEAQKKAQVEVAATPEIFMTPAIDATPDASMSSADDEVVAPTPAPRVPPRPLPTPMKSRRSQLITDKAYQILEKPYAGAIALKLDNGRTLINTVSEVTPYPCPFPHKGKMCLSFPTGDQIVVSPALAPTLPRSFRYHIKHF